MTYPDYLLQTYSAVSRVGKFTDEDRLELYADFIDYYTNNNVFVILSNGNNSWVDWKRKATLDEVERKVINEIFNLTEPTFLLPRITNSKTIKSKFLTEFTETILKYYPIFNKGTGSLKEGAKKLITEVRQVNFNQPVINDNEPLPNFLVAWMKTLEEPQWFNAYRDEETKAINLISNNLEANEKYGYVSSTGHSSEGYDLATYTCIRYEAFFHKYAKYITFNENNLKNRFKLVTKPFFRRAKNSLIGSATAITAATTAGAMVVPDPGMVLIPVTVVSGLALIGTGINYLAASESNRGRGWVTLTKTGKRLLKEIKAWENFVDSSSEDNRYSDKEGLSIFTRAKSRFRSSY